MRLRSTPPVAIATPARCTPPVDRARRAAAAVCRAQRPRGQTSCVDPLPHLANRWMDGRARRSSRLCYCSLIHCHTGTHADTLTRSHHQSDSYVALGQAPATLSLTAQHLSRPKEGNEAKRETSWATAHRTNRGGSSRDRYSSTPMACRLLCSALLVASAGAAFVGLTPSRRTAQRSAIVPLMAAEPIATTAGGSLEVSAIHYSLRSPLHHGHEIRTNARRCVSPRVPHAHHAPPLYSRAG